MVLFSFRWTVKPEHRTHNMTAYASMTEEQIQKMFGPDIKMLGSWTNLGTVSGTIIFDASDVTAINKYAVQWTLDGTTDVTIEPLMYENEFRATMLGVDEPPYIMPLDLDSPLEEGESLYLLHFKFLSQKKGEVIQGIAHVSEETQHRPLKTRKLGGFYEAGGSGGMSVMVAKSPKDILYTLRDWIALAEVDIEPVMRFQEGFDVIRSMPEYEKNLEALKSKMEM